MSTVHLPVDESRGVIRSSARRLAYAAVSLPMAAICLAVLVAGWVIVLCLSFTPLVVPLLLAFAHALALLARVETVLAVRLLDSTVAAPAQPAHVEGYWAKAGHTLRSGSFWRRQTFCLSRMLVAFPLACLSLSLVGGGLAYATAPIHYRWIPQDGGRHGIDFGIWFVDTLPESLALVVPGLLVAVGGVAVTHLLARVWRALAERLLPDSPTVAPAPAFASTPVPSTPTPARAVGWPAPAPGATPTRPAPGRRAWWPSYAGLFAHVAAAAGVIVVCTIVWAATTRGYPWPFWVALPLVTSVLWHAGIVIILRRAAAGWRPHLATPALAIHAFVMVVLELALVAVWAATWRDYPWWLWTALGLSIPVAIHWVVVLSGSIGRLERRRSQAVDVQEDDLQRIERDLHDGAQARLVALGLHLGMAEQKLDTDPDAARALVGEAREGVQSTLAELRNLVRGIRPPVLADRGLEAAVWSLVDRTALPVDIDVTIGERPPDAVETAAYFVVAEALANAAKHAAATRIEVRLERRGTMLSVDVRDDGCGGADPNGLGLRGLRRRVEALGGRVTVVSPERAGTVVHAELPCGR